MAQFQQFRFKECLSSRSLNALPDFLKVANNQYSEVILLRLLTGTLEFENTLTNIKLQQRINFTLTDAETNRRYSAKVIKDVFTIDRNRIDIAKVEDYYIKGPIRGNNQHFENLLLEFCNYFYQTQKESHTTAFLHLYRVTELISYCFPLHFASKGKSYKKTFLSLKEYFKKAESELSFFKIFVNDHLFKDNPILDINLPIRLKQTDVYLKKQYYRALKKLCDQNKNITVKSETQDSEIVITRRGLTSLIIDLRNRYFHLLSGDHNDNFSSKELVEVDYFYNNVNGLIMNWLSLIYIEVLLNSIE